MLNIHFYFRFREAILSGKKIQTCRHYGSRRPPAFYYGEAKLIVNPYNKNREVLKNVELRNCIRFRIDVKHRRIQLWNRVLSTEGNAEFAKNEGFDTEEEFWFYFENHKISQGYCFTWAKTKYRSMLGSEIVDNILTTDKILDEDENNQQ